MSTPDPTPDFDLERDREWAQFGEELEWGTELLVAWLREAADATELHFDYWTVIPGWVAAAGDLAVKITGWTGEQP